MVSSMSDGHYFSQAIAWCRCLMLGSGGILVCGSGRYAVVVAARGGCQSSEFRLARSVPPSSLSTPAVSAVDEKKRRTRAKLEAGTGLGLHSWGKNGSVVTSPTSSLIRV
jgi:hypothetical protein